MFYVYKLGCANTVPHCWHLQSPMHGGGYTIIKGQAKFS